MKRILLSLFLVAQLFTSCKQTSANETVNIVSPEEMKTLLELEDIQLIDVRTPEEFSQGYIANAQNIDYFSKTFDADIAKLDKNKPVIVYCKSGNRSAKCIKKMKEAGFVKIYELNGGISKWQHEGNVITKN